jgi:hypothetical protein
LCGERVERTERGDREGTRDQSRGLIVGELDERPGVREICPDVYQIERAVLPHCVANRVLHERVRDQNEIAREPTPGGETHRCEKMQTRTQPPLSVEEDADERALQEECEHAFHREGLADDAAGVLGESAQLVPNWNSMGCR